MRRLILAALSAMFCTASLAGTQHIYQQKAPAQAEQLYLDNCSICHGSEGNGGVGIPLSLPSFLKQSSDEYIRRSIKFGRPGRVMPAFKHLSDEQIERIVDHIGSWRTQDAIVWDEKKITANAAAGKVLYQQSCSVCHHKNGQGGQGTGVVFSRPKELPISAPAIGNNGFLHSVSDQMIKHIITQGRENTPMPAAHTLGLNEVQVENIVSYLRSLQKPLENLQKKLDDEPPIIVYESEYSMQETIENVQRAAVGLNFRLIRNQSLDFGFVKPEFESKKQEIVFFCNFNFLYKALKLDPRIGMFLPCRITVVETNNKVQVMSINPKRLSHFFNNRSLDDACEKMHNVYTSIMEEATL